MGRTLARAQAALAWSDNTSQTATSPPSTPPPPCAPLSDADLRSYLGPGGRLLRPHDLRLHVYHGGVEPGLRKVGSEPSHSPFWSPDLHSVAPISYCSLPRRWRGLRAASLTLFVLKFGFFCPNILLFLPKRWCGVTY